MNRTAIGIAALTFSVSLDDSGNSKPLQLLPAGTFRARDGRPENIPGWVCTAEIAQRVIARANAETRRIVIDYEHQTLNAEKNGQPAPAAGFFKQMEWREGVGLFATDVDWKARAREMLRAEEYLYLSPVFSYDSTTGEVLQILHVALTNFPALDELPQVALRAAARFQPTLEQENTMDPWLKALLAALGLTDHTEQAVTTALTALKAKADSVPSKDTEITALRATAATVEAKDREIAALKSGGSGGVDLSKFVPIDTMTQLQQQVAMLTAQVHGRDVDELVAGALKEGKLLPAQESWAKELGNKDIASLRAYLDKAQPIAALRGMQTGGQGGQGGQHQAGELGEADLAVCRNMGISPEDYKKQLDAEKA